jgi:TATA-box binding protein (TBP) (component of TFIID and TFIIIB)
MDFKPSEIKIATMTSISNLNTNIDIKVLGKFITLNDTIHEIRYRTLIKNKSGVIINKKPSFYNQVTVKISSGKETFINMKIFSNGQIQMTGCKHEDNIKQAIENITNIIYSINNLYSIKVYTENGLYIGDDDTVYYKNKIIGFKLSKNEYLFNNEHVIYDGKYFVSYSNIIKCKSKNVYNQSGNIIGTEYIRFFEPKKTYKNNDIHLKNNSIFDSKNKHIGDIVNDIPLDLLDPLVPLVPLDGNIVYRYKVVEPNSISNTGFKVVNINSVYDCFSEINREQLLSVLQSINIFAKFDPNTYPGVNIKFIYNNKKNGICSCLNTCRWVNGKATGDNTCKKISIFVFQSGKVIITGANSIEQINTSYDFINSIFTKFYHKIIKQTPSFESSFESSFDSAELDFFNS